MRRPGRVELLVVIARLDVVHRRPGDVFVCRLVALVDLRRLQHMMAATLRLLREGAVSFEALDTNGKEQFIFVHQRRGEPRISLAPFERHPVDAVVVKQIEPFIEAVLIDQARLADHEVDQLLVAWRGHATCPPIDSAMYLAQAENWLRICHSVVPFVSAVTSGFSSALYSRCTLTH